VINTGPEYEKIISLPFKIKSIKEEGEDMYWTRESDRKRKGGKKNLKQEGKWGGKRRKGVTFLTQK